MWLLWFSPYEKEKLEDKKDSIVATLSNEILKEQYENVIINCGNFLLWEKNGEVFPLIPELYTDGKGNIIDQEKRDMCHNWDNLYNTDFSTQSLEMWLNILLHTKSSILSKDITVVPLLAVDDKYIDRDLSTQYMLQWYKAIPSNYRNIFSNVFGGDKTTKSLLRVVPSVFKDSWQIVKNEFILSENELVSRFKTIRNKHINWAKAEYKEYQESLPDKTRKCSLELFHLLKTLVNEKSKIDEWSNNKLCIIQFVPDACEWSAMASAQWIVKNREDIDIISIVPVMTGSSRYIVTKFDQNWQSIIEEIEKK